MWEGVLKYIIRLPHELKLWVNCLDACNSIVRILIFRYRSCLTGCEMSASFVLDFSRVMSALQCIVGILTISQFCSISLRWLFMTFHYNQANYLKSCGAISETPPEILKVSNQIEEEDSNEVTTNKCVLWYFFHVIHRLIFLFDNIVHGHVQQCTGD